MTVVIRLEKLSKTGSLHLTFTYFKTFKAHILSGQLDGMQTTTRILLVKHSMMMAFLTQQKDPSLVFLLTANIG